MGIIIECVMLAYVRCISNNEQYDKGPYVSVVGGAAVCKQFEIPQIFHTQTP